MDELDYIKYLLAQMGHFDEIDHLLSGLESKFATDNHEDQIYLIQSPFIVKSLVNLYKELECAMHIAQQEDDEDLSLHYNLLLRYDKYRFNSIVTEIELMFRDLSWRMVTRKNIQNFEHVINGLINECDHVLRHAVVPKDTVLTENLENKLREYSKKHYEEMRRKLVKEAESHKAARYESLSPKQWGCVLDAELSKIEEEAKELETTEYSKSMYGIIAKVACDEELFDLKCAVNDPYNILDVLGPWEDLFLELILRHNIIRSEMHYNLKRKFFEWMGMEQKCEPMSPEAPLQGTKIINNFYEGSNPTLNQS